MTTSPYAALEARFRRLGALGEAQAVLHWDMATQMPEGGAEARAEQLATLKLIRHDILGDPTLPELFAGADAQNDLDGWQRANLAEMRRSWLHATALPADLVEASSKARSRPARWCGAQARPANDFARVLPALQKVLDLTREVAAVKAEKLGVSPYDALLDQYEPGGSSAAIDRIFTPFAAASARPDRRCARRASASVRKPLVPPGPFPIAQQRAAGVKLMEAIGFDFDHGRLDVSLHPFSRRHARRRAHHHALRRSGFRPRADGRAARDRPRDVRARPAGAWRRQPVGRARGMSIHESQSLLIEMQVCRSREFQVFVAPILREAFGASGPAWEAENLYRLGTQVERSFIRVDADEVTYPAHVILRYRLEQALIAGDLASRISRRPGTTA